MTDEELKALSESWEGEDASEEDDSDLSEVELLKQELAQKDEALNKRRMRAKKGYEKQGKAWSVDAEEVKKIVREEYEATVAKDKFLSSRPDAKDNRSDIEKMSAEKGLSFDEAYKIINFDKTVEENRQSQMSGKYSINWNIWRKEDEWYKLPDVYSQFSPFNQKDIFSKS